VLVWLAYCSFIKFMYSTIFVIRHVWDQGMARLPKTTDYWKNLEQIY
jgi:hypothetical protein